jgi:protein-S-isoprenylcysteine O-methyltransferase Ste14
VFAGFLANLAFLPRTVDRGSASPAGTALAVDALLIALFAVPHSAMARERGRRFGRAFYLFASSIALLLLGGRWHPIPAKLWDLPSPIGRVAVHAAFAAGWVVLVVSTLELDVLAFAGLRSEETPPLRVVGLHRHVRHPTYVGWFLVLWAAPTMTLGHAFLAASLAGYVLVAVRLEERDLLRTHGEAYARYRRDVPAFFPRIRGSQRF